VNRRGVLSGIGLGPAAGKPARAALLPAGVRSETHDVVVIGTGTAGFVAALQARLDGADVVALEKTPEASGGGDSRMSGGIFFVPGQDTAEARQGFVADNERVTQGRGCGTCPGWRRCRWWRSIRGSPRGPTRNGRCGIAWRSTGTASGMSTAGLTGAGNEAVVAAGLEIML
jgi:choline dehydrogenase-like flavoprotein